MGLGIQILPDLHMVSAVSPVECRHRVSQGGIAVEGAQDDGLLSRCLGAVRLFQQSQLTAAGGQIPHDRQDCACFRHMDGRSVFQYIDRGYPGAVDTLVQPVEQGLAPLSRQIISVGGCPVIGQEAVLHAGN